MLSRGLRVPSRGLSAGIRYLAGRPQQHGPERPKRPLSAYQLFLRGQPMGRHGLPESAEKWRSMSHREKVPYEKEAADLFEKFASERASWQQEMGKLNPKNPRSAWTVFVTKQFSALKAKKPEYTPREVLTELSKQWNSMTKDQKQPFEAEAETNRHRVQSLAPPKYALNPYAHYYAQKYREVVGTNPSVTFTEASKMMADFWRKMSEDDKKPYVEAADAARRAKELAKGEHDPDHSA